MIVADKAIASIDAASRSTFRKFFLALPTLLHVVFTQEHMSRGFADTGLLPFDQLTVLRHWPLFARLRTEGVNGIVRECTELTEWVISKQRGYVTYSELYARIEEFLPDEYRLPQEKITNLDSVYNMQQGRWGAVWLNTASTLARRATNAETQRQREEQRAAGGRGRGRGRAGGRTGGRGEDQGGGESAGRDGRGRGAPGGTTAISSSNEVSEGSDGSDEWVPRSQASAPAVSHAGVPASAGPLFSIQRKLIYTQQFLPRTGKPLNVGC